MGMTPTLFKSSNHILSAELLGTDLQRRTRAERLRWHAL